MTDNNIFRNQVGPQASKLIGSQHSLFDRRMRQVFVPHAKDIRTLTPVNSVATTLPTSGSIQFAQDFDRCDWLELKVTIPALTAGGAATFTRLVDYFGAQLFERIQCKFSGQEIQEIRPLEWYKAQRDMLPELRQDYIEPLGGGLSIAERNSRALAQQVFYIRIPVYWARSWRADKRRDLGLNPYVISQPFEVYFETAQYRDLVQTDDAASTPFTFNVEAYAVVQHTLPRERATRIAETRGGLGTIIPLPYYKFIREKVISAGASSYQLDISSIQLPVKILEILFRERSDLTTNYGKDYTNLSWDLVPDEMELVIGGVTLLQRQVVRPMMRYNACKYGVENAPPVLRVLFTEAPIHTLISDGAFLGLDILRNNVFLNLYWDAPIANDIQIDLLAECFNALQRKAGTERRLFS